MMNENYHEIWEKNAEFWDESVGESNNFQQHLINPAVMRLLNIRAGHRVLDVACGNGSFSRQLAAKGAQVVAFDFSETFIRRAKSRTTNHADQIDYLVLDATDKPKLLSTLGDKQFDRVVCNMALMDIPTIGPLLEVLTIVLKPNGLFIFSVSHPCFNSIGSSLMITGEDRDGEYIVQYAVKTTGYASQTTQRGIGIRNQPSPHFYFHRSISHLFKRCFTVGFVLTGIEEPVFDNTVAAKHPLSWENYKDIPPVLVARMSLLRHD